MVCKKPHTWALLILAAAAYTAAGLDFEMTAQSKCIFEELNANVIVVGDYKAVNRDNPSVPIYVDVRVRALRLLAWWRTARALLPAVAWCAAATPCLLSCASGD